MDLRQGMALLMFVAVALMAYVAQLSYRRRQLPVARTMVLIMIAAAAYAFGCAFELMSRTLGEAKFALQLEYIGIPFVSTLWLFQVVQFTGVAARYRKPLALLLFVVPVAVFAIHLTNDWHGLIYERYNLNESGLPLYTTVKGPWYTVHTVYNYGVLIAGMALLAPRLRRASPLGRRQILIHVLGAAAPVFFNLIFWSGIAVDLTPLGFAVSGIVYAWGILRLDLLRLTPLALAKVFETIRDGVVLLDPEGRIVSYNRAAEEALPELAQARSEPRFAADVLADCPELVARLRASGAGSSAADERFPFRRFRSNRHMHYSCRLSLIFDTGKLPIGKMLMFYDITELKENEARLRENARQLSELNAFKDKLFTVVAHDIRDPIALLVSLTELLGEELTSADLAHADLFRELQGQVRNTFQLVENLLDWYRSQRGSIAFRPTGWNVRQVARQALSLAGAKAGMKRIRLAERIDGKLRVTADKEMLDLILRNLLSNAIKYTAVGGEIELDAERKGDRIVVSVRDNGAGIDERTARMLRQEEPFLKGVAAGGESIDARFGLALTREFVRIHGGSLWFDSSPGLGTTFSFTLPIADEARMAPDEAGTEGEAYEGYFGG